MLARELELVGGGCTEARAALPSRRTSGVSGVSFDTSRAARSCLASTATGADTGAVLEAASSEANDTDFDAIVRVEKLMRERTGGG